MASNNRRNSGKIKKIILAGGSTGGSVTPLLAMVDTLNEKKVFNYEFFWLGTSAGIERRMVANAKIRFISITGGKWRRYFSISNFFDIFKIIIGFLESFFIILFYRPDIIISAGSFISVPVVWAGWILRVRALIHQQDYLPGLANKLMAPFSSVVTVTFEKSVNDYGQKAIWTGNVLRKEFLQNNSSPESARQALKLNADFPVLLVIGGGTGALFLNNLIGRCQKELESFCQIILISGNRGQIKDSGQNLIVYPYLSAQAMVKAYLAADVVVSRCGLSVLTELAFFGKPTILVPIPDSHQMDNARIFEDNKAALVLKQKEIKPDIFTSLVKQLLQNKEKMSALSANMKKMIKIDTSGQIAGIINKIIK